MMTNGKIPELQEMNEEAFKQWYSSIAQHPLTMMTAHCPHCGSNDITAIVKYRDMRDDQGRTFEVFQNCQIKCRHCLARGGMYERELFRSTETPKQQKQKNWSIVQGAVGLWNLRY